jgi:hypothetical protein
MPLSYYKTFTVGAVADVLLSALDTFPSIIGADLVQWELRVEGTAELRPIFGANTGHTQIVLTDSTNIASLSRVTDWRLTSTAGAVITLAAHRG